MKTANLNPALAIVSQLKAIRDIREVIKTDEAARPDHFIMISLHRRADGASLTRPIIRRNIDPRATGAWLDSTEAELVKMLTELGVEE